MSGPRHYDDEIQELLDGRLPDAARAEVEEHLRACELCRSRLESLRWVKDQTARLRLGPAVPGALLTKLRRALDAEDARMASRVPWPRLAWTLGGLAAAVALLLVFALPRRVDIPAAVVRDYRDYLAGKLPLGLETTDAAQLENYFTREGVGFATRVFDLGMMRYRLVGGRVHALAGRRGVLFVYRGEGGEAVVCRMYRGALRELPAPSERREHDGIAFRIYRREGLTLVFWQEDEVVCVLAGTGDPEAVVQLAFAKAVKGLRSG